MSHNDKKTRQRLLDSAIHEFAEHGYEGATVRKICARADANLNAVKYHFQDKQQLYMVAVKSVFESGEVLQDGQLLADKTPQEQLRFCIEQLLTIAFTNEKNATSSQRLFLREMCSPSQEMVDYSRAKITPLFKTLDRILKELTPGKASNLDRHMLVLSVIGQCMHYKFCSTMDSFFIPKSEQRRFTVPRLTQHIMKVTMAAVSQF